MPKSAFDADGVGTSKSPSEDRAISAAVHANKQGLDDFSAIFSGAF